MATLVLGLVLFLGVHSIRIVAETGRSALIDRFGEPAYKGIYAVLSLIGIVLVSMGYSEARASAVLVYQPVPGLSHLSLILVSVAFVLVTAAYVPMGRIKAAVAHPMALGVAVWALGHLLANGTSADLVLFGSFFVWAVLDFIAARRRTASAGPAAATVKGDVMALGIGLIGSAVFIGGLHQWLFGVSPIG